MTSISKFLSSNGFHEFIEGYSQEIPDQVKDLITLSNHSNIQMMEIGFNAGHSAEIFLQNNPSILLTSFDMGAYDYVDKAKEYIDSTYPNRHTLILGDSTVTIPKYIKENSDKVFDVIFIDGGHDYEIANADLENCKKLANKNTIVIMDDTIFRNDWEAHYTIGPTKAWIEHINRGEIREINRVEYKGGRGMSWGKYIL